VSFDEIMGVRRQTARPRAVSTTNVEVIKGSQLSVETF
jgi:hypothetical protein